MYISIVDTDPLANFNSFNEELKSVLLNLRKYPGEIQEGVGYLLNGEASSALRRHVSEPVRKANGLFFTSELLANQLAANIQDILSQGRKFLDPACGAGNLLISCAKHLPVRRGLADTIQLWSEVIHGCDLHDTFVEATKLRLLLLAAMRTKDFDAIGTYIDNKDVFPGVKVGDAWKQPYYPDVECYVVNPPFGYIEAPENCSWTSGKVQKAAMFVNLIFNSTSPGNQLIAILPDVLRSGTRYIRWRAEIARQSGSVKVETAGRFDCFTDVDVFFLHLQKMHVGQRGCRWPISDTIRSRRIKVKDRFDVHVGPVVPHRNAGIGSYYPYIHARNTLAWQTLHHIDETIRFSGTLYQPPFVVIHRTSSPNDKNRCVSTIIKGQRKVAIENHLLVALPRDNTLGSCEVLLDNLRNDTTNVWMNEHIRCRHLTVLSLKELPFWDD